MTNPLQTLETDLGKLAQADTTNPQGGTAQPQTPLTQAQLVLSVLADQNLVGSTISAAMSGVYTAIAAAITDDVVKALQAIAGELTQITGLSLSDAASGLGALQNALQAAQSLVPGASSATASAFASTTQFATLFGDLMQGATSVDDAANQLYEIAQQLQAIAEAFTTASQGNP